MSDFTSEELLACAERESRLRELVYPRLVEKGSMSADKAKTEVLMMVEISRILRLAVVKERLI